MKFLIGIMLGFLVFNASAEYKCSDEREGFGLYFLHQFENRDKKCVIRLSYKNDNISRRSFQFFANGLFEVYTNIKGSDGLGARSYFIVPTSEGPKFENLGVMAKIHDSSGLTWLLGENGKLSNDNGCKIQQSALTSWEDEARVKSGFYIQSCPGSLVFDLGFKRGEPANISNPNHKITVRDHFGNSCQIKNSDLLVYKKGEFDKLKYKANQDLKSAILKIKGCEKVAENFSPSSTSTVNDAGAVL